MDKDAGLDAGAGYGTRSRNRGGNARPNYAEDKDIEMDVYDYYHDGKKDGDGPGKKSSRQASINGGVEATRASVVSRKAGADDAKAAPSQNGHKDQGSNGTTGASQATTQTQPTGASQTSRKRKAAAGATPSSTVVSARKASGAAQNPGTTWPDTNMLSFDNCKARTDNGRMVADDGTVLEANGKLQ